MIIGINLIATLSSSGLAQPVGPIPIATVKNEPTSAEGATAKPRLYEGVKKLA